MHLRMASAEKREKQMALELVPHLETVKALEILLGRRLALMWLVR